jgi:hypothetical protein
VSPEHRHLTLEHLLWDGRGMRGCGRNEEVGEKKKQATSRRFSRRATRVLDWSQTSQDGGVPSESFVGCWGRDQGLS